MQGVGYLSSHRQANGKWPKCDRGINKDDSQLILKMTGIFLQVGSGICSTCHKKLRALMLTSPHKAESVIDQMDALILVGIRRCYAGYLRRKMLLLFYAIGVCAEPMNDRSPDHRRGVKRRKIRKQRRLKNFLIKIIIPNYLYRQLVIMFGMMLIFLILIDDMTK
ncbi:Hypothetical predicted protein [Paramuricea clavata]|uniref:Uncharacterized protein n=1 Tax=Paramuricea clavata TaxID=317549 RepID=A0A7D9I1X4_PARCT|nr:Hypothetical predicted protein [Paramuricea clavata]